MCQSLYPSLSNSSLVLPTPVPPRSIYAFVGILLQVRDRKQNSDPAWSGVHSTDLAARKLMRLKVPRWRGSSVQHGATWGVQWGERLKATFTCSCQQLLFVFFLAQRFLFYSVPCHLVPTVVHSVLLFLFVFVFVLVSNFCADWICQSDVHGITICLHGRSNQSQLCCMVRYGELCCVSSAVILALQLTATGASTISAGTDHSCWITSDSAAWSNIKVRHQT